MTELVEVMLLKVQNGTPINKAAIEVFGRFEYYYRIATKEEKSRVLRARHEFTEKQQVLSSSRVVFKRIPMPASRREKLQQICDERKEPVNVVANRLFNLLIKHPDLFERIT